MYNITLQSYQSRYFFFHITSNVFPIFRTVIAYPLLFNNIVTVFNMNNVLIIDSVTRKINFNIRNDSSSFKNGFCLLLSKSPETGFIDLYPRFSSFRSLFTAAQMSESGYGTSGHRNTPERIPQKSRTIISVFRDLHRALRTHKCITSVAAAVLCRKIRFGFYETTTPPSPPPLPR